MVKRALEPYAHILQNYENKPNDDDSDMVMKRSRELYVKLVAIKCNIIESTDMCPNLYQMCTQLDISVEDSCTLMLLRTSASYGRYATRVIDSQNVQEKKASVSRNVPLSS